MQKQKSANLRPKLLFWVFLDLELEKAIMILGIGTLKFAEMQKIMKKKKKQFLNQKCLNAQKCLELVKMQSFVQN